jgi:hypothetical protein
VLLSSSGWKSKPNMERIEEKNCLIIMMFVKLWSANQLGIKKWGSNVKKNIIQNEETQDYNHLRQLWRRMCIQSKI